MMYPGKYSESDMPPLCTKRPVVANSTLGTGRKAACIVHANVTPLLHFEHLPGCHQYLVECVLARPKNALRDASKGFGRSLCYNVETPEGFDFVAPPPMLATASKGRSSSKERRSSSKDQGRSGTKTPDKKTLPCNLVGVVPGRYRCRVKARNKNGYGVWSLPSRAFTLLDEAQAAQRERALELALDDGDLDSMAAAVAEAERVPVANAAKLEAVRGLLRERLATRTTEARLRAVMEKGGDEDLSKLCEELPEANELVQQARQGMQAKEAAVSAELARVAKGTDVAELVMVLERVQAYSAIDQDLVKAAKKRLDEVVCETRLTYAVYQGNEEAVTQALEMAKEAKVPLVKEAEEAQKILKLKHMRDDLREALQKASQDELQAIITKVTTEGPSAAQQKALGVNLQDELRAAETKIKVLCVEQQLRESVEAKDIETMKSAVEQADFLIEQSKDIKMSGFAGPRQAFVDQCRQEYVWQEQTGALRKGMNNNSGKQVMEELNKARSLTITDDSVLKEVQKWLEKTTSKDMKRRSSLQELVIETAMMCEDSDGLHRTIAAEADTAPAALLATARRRVAELQRSERLREACDREDEDGIRRVLEEPTGREGPLLDDTLERTAQALLRRLVHEGHLRAETKIAKGFLKAGLSNDTIRARAKKQEETLRQQLEEAEAIKEIRKDVARKALEAKNMLEYERLRLELTEATVEQDENKLYDLALLHKEHLVDVRRGALIVLCKMRVEKAKAGDDLGVLKLALKEARTVLEDEGDKEFIRRAEEMWEVVECRDLLSRGIEDNDVDKLEQGLAVIQRAAAKDESIHALGVQARQHRDTLMVNKVIKEGDLEHIHGVLQRIESGEVSVSDALRQDLIDKHRNLALLADIGKARKSEDIKKIKQCMAQDHAIYVLDEHVFKDAQDFLLGYLKRQLIPFHGLSREWPKGQQEAKEDKEEEEEHEEEEKEEEEEEHAEEEETAEEVQEEVPEPEAGFDEAALEEVLDLAHGIAGVDEALLEGGRRLMAKHLQASLEHARRKDNAGAIERMVMRIERLAGVGVPGAGSQLVQEAKLRSEALRCQESLSEAIEHQSLGQLGEALKKANSCKFVSSELLGKAEQLRKVLKCKKQLQELQNSEELQAAIDEADLLGIELKDVLRAKERLKGVKTRETAKQKDREVQDRAKAKKLSKYLCSAIDELKAKPGGAVEESLHKLVLEASACAFQNAELEKTLADARECLTQRGRTDLLDEAGSS